MITLHSIARTSSVFGMKGRTFASGYNLPTIVLIYSLFIEIHNCETISSVLIEFMSAFGILKII